MDDLELWELSSRAPEALRGEVLARLAADGEQRERVKELLAQPAPPRAEGARYEIVGLIGAGTQADVYQARRLDLDRACALKVFRNVADPAFVERVRAEAGLMARVFSPHVVTVFDAGDLGGGRYFIEMALCAEPDPSGSPGALALGRSLRAWVAERGPLAPDDAARLLEPLCAAVDSAHRVGIVHSDVKPENVLVLPASRRPMLADFGVAASLAGPRPARRIGTIPYLAPEVLSGRCAPDAASDVYGLGGTLQFALTGRPPHPDRDASGASPSGDRPAPLPPSVPDSLREIVERALHPDPDARPSAAQLASALDAFVARVPAPWELNRPRRRLSLFYQRHHTLLNLGFFGLVVAATLGLGLLRTVIAKTGLESRSHELVSTIAGLDSDVRRLEEQRGALQDEVERLRADRETIAGSEAQEREGRLRAEGRATEADLQLTTATGVARETSARLARAEANAADLASRLAAAETRLRAAESDVATRGAEARAASDRFRSTLEAMRQSWDAERDRLRADLAREREQVDARDERIAELDKERAAAIQARAAAETRLQERLDAVRAERDELRERLDLLRGEARRPAPAGPSSTR